jgi:hypothetical protein
LVEQVTGIESAKPPARAQSERKTFVLRSDRSHSRTATYCRQYGIERKDRKKTQVLS